jgi:cephalosporin-C deacetylase-like acetyl esterase
MDKAIAKDLTLRDSDAVLRLQHGPGERIMSFKQGDGFNEWSAKCKDKLAHLLGVESRKEKAVFKMLRKITVDDVTVNVVQMRIEEGLSVPAYYLVPKKKAAHFPVMAIHGHGEAESCIGIRDDYHHSFALHLAQNGYAVLCPELRGFGVLKDMARDLEEAKLDYWDWGGHMAYSLVSEGNLHGRPLFGQTVVDLLAWEEWLCSMEKVDQVHVAGISYGGDLAIAYPAFSGRAKSIFASGSLGSFSVIFSECYNAPAHTIPSILRYMDRSDIAGLNAPTPIALHYGELDRPGPKNHSASYNKTVPQSLDELCTIYAAVQGSTPPRLLVTSGKGHEMDNSKLLEFIGQQDLANKALEWTP